MRQSYDQKTSFARKATLNLGNWNQYREALVISTGLCAQHHCESIVDQISGFQLSSSLCFLLEPEGETNPSCSLFSAVRLHFDEDVCPVSLSPLILTNGKRSLNYITFF